MSVASFLIMLLIPPFIALVHDSFSVSYCSSQMGTQQISYHYWMTFLPFIFFYASKGMTMHCIWELPILLPETFKVLSNCTIWISAPARYYIGASKRHCLNSQNEDWVQFFFFLFLSIYQKHQQIKRQIYSANSLIDQNHTVADFGHCCCTVCTQ